MAKTDQHERTAREWLMELRNPNAQTPLVDRLRGQHASFATDAHIAAAHLDTACDLCDRAQDYLSLRLGHDPAAQALAEELRRFIGRVEHVIVPDDETPNVESNRRDGIAGTSGLTAGLEG